MPPESFSTPRGPADASRPLPARLGRTLRAAVDLLWLELKVVTGNRAIVLVVVEAAWFAIVAISAHFQSQPWALESYYNRSVLVPALVPAIALAMVAVTGDRDSRQLEVAFVSPGGRYRLWCFRFAAITLACAASALGLSVATWLVIDREFSALTAAVHAVFPIAAVVAVTVFVSVLFRSGSVAGLVAVATLVLSVLVFHSGGPNRFDVFLNPFVPPRDLILPIDWIRILFWNRVLLTLVAGAGLGLTLVFLQRRERLL